MSGSKRNITVSREYKAAPDDCARALELLLNKSVLFDSQASKGGPHDLTRHPTKECTTRQDKKGMQNADLHGD